MKKRFLLKLIVNSLSLYITAQLVSGIHVSGIATLIITALIIGLVNSFIKPIVMFLTLPFNIMTLGLFTFVVNAVLFILVSAIVPGFNISGFWPGFAGSLIMSIISAILNKII